LDSTFHHCGRSAGHVRWVVPRAVHPHHNVILQSEHAVHSMTASNHQCGNPGVSATLVVGDRVRKRRGYRRANHGVARGGGRGRLGRRDKRRHAPSAGDVHVDSPCPPTAERRLVPSCLQPLSLSSENPVSKCAFKWVNLHRYTSASVVLVQRRGERPGVHAQARWGCGPVEFS
jgi:hypothetical protein